LLSNFFRCENNSLVPPAIDIITVAIVTVAIVTVAIVIAITAAIVFAIIVALIVAITLRYQNRFGNPRRPLPRIVEILTCAIIAVRVAIFAFRRGVGKSMGLRCLGRWLWGGRSRFGAVCCWV